MTCLRCLSLCALSTIQAKAYCTYVLDDDCSFILMQGFVNESSGWMLTRCCDDSTTPSSSSIKSKLSLTVSEMQSRGYKKYLNKKRDSICVPSRAAQHLYHLSKLVSYANPARVESTSVTNKTSFSHEWWLFSLAHALSNANSWLTVCSLTFAIQFVLKSSSIFITNKRPSWLNFPLAIFNSIGLLYKFGIRYFSLSTVRCTYPICYMSTDWKYHVIGSLVLVTGLQDLSD